MQENIHSPKFKIGEVLYDQSLYGKWRKPMVVKDIYHRNKLPSTLKTKCPLEEFGNYWYLMEYIDGSPMHYTSFYSSTPLNQTLFCVGFLQRLSIPIYFHDF